MNEKSQEVTKKAVCVVIGVGPGNGAAFARRFANNGYAVALLARSLDFTSQVAQMLPMARAYSCDITDVNAIENTFAAISNEMGDVNVLIYNVGKGIWGTIENVSLDDFERAWRINTLGAYVAALQVIPAMRRIGDGNIVFIGATASRRGGANTVAFASAKAAQRSLAQSLARYLGPHGIHVSLIIIDGIIDSPELREQLPEKPNSFFIQPDEVAETAYRLTQQNNSAWTFKLEVRPFQELW